MPGRFKLDENLPQGAEALLSEGGHEVDTVLGEGLGGERDPTVLAAAKSENRIFVTLDLDFADIRSYPPSIYLGILVLRPNSQSVENIVSLLQGALSLLETEGASISYGSSSQVGFGSMNNAQRSVPGADIAPDALRTLEPATESST